MVSRQSIVWASRKSNAHELPLRIGGEKIAVCGTDMRERRRTGTAAQYVLITHELPIVFTDVKCESVMTIEKSHLIRRRGSINSE